MENNYRSEPKRATAKDTETSTGSVKAGLIRADAAEERISETEDRSEEILAVGKSIEWERKGGMT